MSTVVDSSSVSSVRSDLESNVVSEWLSSVDSKALVDVPGLVKTIVAVVEDNVSVLRVRVSMDIKALSSVVLEVSS